MSVVSYVLCYFLCTDKCVDQNNREGYVRLDKGALRKAPIDTKQW